jgi:hypothetical protein
VAVGILGGRFRKMKSKDYDKIAAELRARKSHTEYIQNMLHDCWSKMRKAYIQGNKEEFLTQRHYYYMYVDENIRDDMECAALAHRALFAESFTNEKSFMDFLES